MAAKAIRANTTNQGHRWNEYEGECSDDQMQTKPSTAASKTTHKEQHGYSTKAIRRLP